ncbi:MAG: class I SAM-dependent methyltransferase [Euryarchaeota archaeon]|nr:class I SAM-dependent methyltransferase [Euryarchaeota archaeon]
MTGIINWNELWKAMRSGHQRRGDPGEDMGSRWDKRAKKFNESVMQHTERTERQIAKLELKPEYTVLDVGAGTGRLTVPIAKQVKSVTAVDPSTGMLACLEENVEREGITNVTSINKRWEDIEPGVDIEPHDVVIACHSLGMLDIQEALTKMDAASKRYVYIINFAGRWMGNGDGELLKAVLGEKHRPRHPLDYILFYNILHDMNIYANVDILDTVFEQHYDSLDDAVNRWREMRDIPEEKANVLRAHLSKILVKDTETGALSFKRKSKSATIWWQKNENTDLR